MRLARADRRRRVLLLSTDPAHSLGDVFRAEVGRHRRPDARRAAESGRARARCGRRAGVAAGGVRRRLRRDRRGGRHRRRRFHDRRRRADGPRAARHRRAVRRSSPSSRRARPTTSSSSTPRPPGTRCGCSRCRTPRANGCRCCCGSCSSTGRWCGPAGWRQSSSSVSKSIRELIALLRDDGTTRFIVVTRAAELPRRETERLRRRLRRLHLVGAGDRRERAHA